MEQEVLFYEKQRLRQWWLWVILIMINGIFIIGLVRQLFWGVSFGGHPMSNTGLILVTVLCTALTILFLTTKLHTKITHNEISVQLFPFHLKPKVFYWSSIKSAYVREYYPIADFGGWGIRYGVQGKVYSLSGNIGLQLIFKNGKWLLIGTQKSKELEMVLSQIPKFNLFLPKENT